MVFWKKLLRTFFGQKECDSIFIQITLSLKRWESGPKWYIILNFFFFLNFYYFFSYHPETKLFLKKMLSEGLETIFCAITFSGKWVLRSKYVWNTNIQCIVIENFIFNNFFSSFHLSLKLGSKKRKTFKKCSERNFHTSSGPRWKLIYISYRREWN